MKYKTCVSAGVFCIAQLASPMASAAGSNALPGLVPGLFSTLNTIVVQVPLGPLGTLGSQSLSTYKLDVIPILGAVGGTVTVSEALFILGSAFAAQGPVLTGAPLSGIRGLPALPGLEGLAGQ